MIGKEEIRANGCGTGGEEQGQDYGADGGRDRGW